MKNFSVEYFVQTLARIADNAIDEAELFGWLDAAVEKVESDYSLVKQRCEQTGYHEESPQEIDWGMTALENYRESLGLVEDYLEAGDFKLLEQAAELAVSVHQMFEAARDENEALSQEAVMDFCC